MESDETQLPYSYYEVDFMCAPGKDLHAQPLSLGEVLRGDRIWGSGYELFFEKDEICKGLCDRTVEPAAVKRADEMIRKNYVVEWILDSLPSGTTFISSTNGEKYYAAGFPLGFVENDKTYIHNHIILVIRWHKEDGDPLRKTIVGFEVYPRSVLDGSCPGASKDFDNFELDPAKSTPTTIPFTYAVYWREESEISWSKRWDLYFSGEIEQEQIHWISLINSVMLVLLFSAIVGVVLLRTLSKDISAFKASSDPFSRQLQTLTNDKVSEKTSAGWKSVVSEVFNEPPRATLLAVVAGSGTQLAFTAIGVSILCASGIMGPRYRGSVLSTSMALFVLAGITAGFSGVSFYRKISAVSGSLRNWPRLSLYCGAGLPMMVLSFVLIMNLFVWAKDSSMALPFGTIVGLILSFTMVEVPLALVGGYISNKRSSDSKERTTINPIEDGASLSVRQTIPKQPFYNKLYVAVPLFGLFPFGVVYVELLFIFRSIWLEKTSFYYMYGFLLATLLLLVIVVVETTIVSTYLSLNNRDYMWQWRSFVIGCSISFYLCIYGVYYFFAYLSITDFVSILLYFFYIVLIAGGVGITCGSIGLGSAIVFVSTMYGAIKED